ncbi:Metalloprotease [Auriculariales sp. MPI-PUGE-AT-0066]|nr:Metalloprotease [Auriculariales sp. MPI-PUGE-AT-0066]
MFSKALTILVLAAAALAAPTVPGELKVSVAAPESMSSLDGLKVVASVTNTGTEDVTVLNIGTILDATRATKSFKVTKDDTPVAFTGVRIYPNMGNLPESAYTTIKAGETVTVEHDVSALYDFEGALEGDFTFTPNAVLPIVTNKIAGSAPELKIVELTDLPSAAVKLSGDLARRELPGSKNAKRATVSCSNSSRASFISQTYAESKVLAGYARDYASSNGTSSLVKAFWKTNSASTVATRFNSVATENTSGRTLNCSDPYDICDEAVAYTVISGNNPIYFCDSYFSFPNPTSSQCGVSTTEQMSAAAVALHESTHAVLGTDDINYGCTGDQSLSASNQLNNADNYNCFAMWVFLQTRC